jgi:DNA-binding transcriptional MerR regulator
MFRIGEFSRLSQVTIKTLHHYDEMGLLIPAHIDRFTGYRYYSVEQLVHIHQILALKDLGLSLEQIGSLIKDNLSAEQIRTALQVQQAGVKAHILEEQARLSRIEFRLRMIDLEVNMPDLAVVVKTLSPMQALTLRTSISGESPVEQLLAFQREIEQAMAQYRIKLASPVTEIHYGEEFRLDFEDVEFVFPVDENQPKLVPLESAGTLTLKTVPGLPLAATYVHHGNDDEQLSEALPLLQRWIVENGYRLRGTYRIVNHRGPLEHAEYADWIMEFQHEIEPITDSSST